ncbi:hypothetical protein C8J56DRAFT_1038057 [Mycena floridula]|nr:hypothetical protein C8J56DRAFT_1038057 [Mycena floridula]
MVPLTGMHDDFIAIPFEKKIYVWDMKRMILVSSLLHDLKAACPDRWPLKESVLDSVVFTAKGLFLVAGGSLPTQDETLQSIVLIWDWKMAALVHRLIIPHELHGLVVYQDNSLPWNSTTAISTVVFLAFSHGWNDAIVINETDTGCEPVVLSNGKGLNEYFENIADLECFSYKHNSGCAMTRFQDGISGNSSWNWLEIDVDPEAAAFSPHGESFVVGSLGGTIEKGRTRGELNATRRDISDVAACSDLSQDGSTLAIAYESGLLEIGPVKSVLARRQHSGWTLQMDPVRLIRLTP